ncbi:MAG TPA: MFS transporter [Solirubrobacteraceae bacterium]|nr:MFS transporter [Solirubrobacteraceae bacterium]
MRLNDLRRSGHAPSLAAAVIHFDVSFMCWVLLGALGAYIAEDLHLTSFGKGVVVAVPLLSAAFFRLVLGLLGDRIGPKRVGTASMAIVALPLLWGWLAAGSLPQVLGVGLLLGVAGASFAIALPLASRWYPPDLQGLAMGIVGAGNSGTVIATLVAPRLAQSLGWHAVMGLALIPVGLALGAFVLFAREPPRSARPLSARGMARMLKEADARRVAGLYAVTFGGFVGLTSFLPILLHDQYGLSKVDAATITACGGFLGSFLRPVGGHLGDRIGGTTVLSCVLGIAGAALLFVSGTPSVDVAALAFVVAMGALGVGNGAVFQLVGLRFPERIGAMTGIVGAAGGIGGFALPFGLGAVKQLTGSYGVGLALLAAAAGSTLLIVRIVRGAMQVRAGGIAQPSSPVAAAELRA